jgi:hypothetical protein
MSAAEGVYYGLAALGLLLSFARLRVEKTVSGKGLGNSR